MPILFMLADGVLLVFSVIDRTMHTLAGMAVILCGIPVHALYQRTKGA